MTSGTEARLDNLQSKLFEVLDRRLPIAPLDALINALSSNATDRAALPNCAIGFDSSVFLRLGKSRNIADITDYLGSEHSAPIILPGQTIQEFWNNQLAAVDTMTMSVKKKFDLFRTEAVKLGDEGFVENADELINLINEFDDEYGHVYDEATVRQVSTLMAVLKDKAIVPHVPRLPFREMAEQRKRSKTPPGFKDDGDGDFYVWADFLYGLLQAKESGQQFTHAILLTHDKKSDWSRKQVPHPILSAEVKALVDVSFELWTIPDLQAAVSAQLQTEPSNPQPVAPQAAQAVNI